MRIAHAAVVAIVTLGLTACTIVMPQDPLAPTPTMTARPTFTATPDATATPVPTNTPQATPTPEATDTPTPAPTITHVVASGETLSGIAERYGVSMDVIIQANGIQNPSLVSIGQELMIPTE